MTTAADHGKMFFRNFLFWFSKGFVGFVAREFPLGSVRKILARFPSWLLVIFLFFQIPRRLLFGLVPLKWATYSKTTTYRHPKSRPSRPAHAPGRPYPWADHELGELGLQKLEVVVAETSPSSTGFWTKLDFEVLHGARFGQVILNSYCTAFFVLPAFFKF